MGGLLQAVRRVIVSILLGSFAALGPVSTAGAEEGRHRHHISMSSGAAWHGSDSSAYLGLDYAYTFSNGLSAAVFVEQVRGDFDLAAYGVAFGHLFDNGFKLSTGPGFETKLKNDETLFLWHVSAGYDWHFGNWSVGPIATFDYIEDASNTVYVGVSIGRAF